MELCSLTFIVKTEAQTEQHKHSQFHVVEAEAGEVRQVFVLHLLLLLFLLLHHRHRRRHPHRSSGRGRSRRDAFWGNSTVALITLTEPLWAVYRNAMSFGLSVKGQNKANVPELRLLSGCEGLMIPVEMSLERRSLTSTCPKWFSGATA